MFWRFNYLTSDIDNLLDKEDVTLLEILNEDDVLQECKAQNKKLVDFLVRPENLERLVGFVIQSPTADQIDEKMRYKYPNIACELLTSDVNQITDALVTSGPLLDNVMNFLEPDEPLNPLQASFFGKVVGLLITRKGELVVDFLKSHDQFLGRVLHHLGTSAIMDLLLRLVTSLDPPEARTACIAWIQEQQLINKLVSMVDPAQSAERNCNAAQALCDLICIMREQITQGSDSPSQQQSDPLLAEIEARDTVSSLLSHMFDGGEIVESVITSGLQVIQTLLEYRRVGPEGNLEQMIQADMERFSQGINNTVDAIVPRLKDFHQLLLHPPKQHYLPMPWTLGVLDTPLGNTRLQTVRLIATLLSTGTTAISEELVRLGTINVLLDLYFTYSWNNFLHRQVEICLSTILLNDSTDSLLLTQLITEFKLLEKVVKGFDDNQTLQSSLGGHRQGYMGHLTRIANCLVNNAGNGKNAQRIEDLILGLPAEVRDRWEQFKAGPLADTNKKNTCELVSGSGISSTNEMDEFGRIAFPQDGQKFGFNEDDLNGSDDDTTLPFGEQRLSLSPGGNTADSAAMFEDACNRRVFDQNDITDEDLWVEKEITFSPAAVPAAESTSTAVRASASGGRMVVSDPDSDDAEDDSEERRNSSDDSDEEEVVPESRRRIVSQPETSRVGGGVRTAAEDMDISSSDDWARFDDIMDVTPGSSAQPLPWDAATPDKAFAVDTSSNSANDSWATFGPETSPKVGASTDADDESSWADFTGFGCSGQQHNSLEFIPSSSSEPDIITSNRTAAYVVSSSSDVDSVSRVSSSVVTTDVCSSVVGSETPVYFEAHFPTVDVCTSSAPEELRTSEGLSSTGHAVSLPSADSGATL